jgi:chaperonin GroEL
LVLNKLKAPGFNVVAVKAPGFGDKQKAMLEDIAALTGGHFVSEGAGDMLDGKEVDGICGRADSVLVGKDFTRIVGGKFDQDVLDARVEVIRGGIEKAESDFEADQLKERLAKLTAGVAIINVGASSEAELKELKERVKDAVSATKAAIEEGVVPGGGVALLSARNVIKDLKLTGDAVFGATMVYEALEQPVYHLLKNAGEKPDAVIAKLLTLPQTEGYDVMTKKYGDMYVAGVIDPVKVTRLALENAASVAAMVVTTEALVADIPAPEPSRQA